MRCIGLLLTTLLCSASMAGSQVDLLADWEGPSPGEQFGIALAIGGDANNDGLADLAIGASTNDEGGENAGKVYIYFGRGTPAADPDVELIGMAGSFFGSEVAWAGDVDGDGHDDLLVGAFRDSEAGANAGKAYLFLGGEPMGTLPALTLVGPAAGAYFGRAVSGAGDLNGDLLADFAVGAPRTANGTVYVYFGGDPPDGTADLVLNGAAEGDRFGSVMAGPGNVDGLPGDDLLVGAPRVSTAHFWQGAAFLFSGGAIPDTLADWSYIGDGAGDQFGSAVAGGGDVNGDGIDDLLVGAPYLNAAGLVDAGGAYLFYGGTPISATPDLLITGSSQEENLGWSVAGCGDVTGSGFGHFVIGAPGDDGGGQDTGRVVMSPGGNPPDPADFVWFSGEQPDDQYGYSVSGMAHAGVESFTGDSRPDWVTGAWGHGTAGKGYLYGLPGAAAIDPGDGNCGDGNRGYARDGLALALGGNPARTFTFTLAGEEHSLSESAAHGRRGDAASSALQVLRLDIVAIDGRRVRSFTFSGRDGAMPVVHWDGRRQDGRRAAAGIYLVICARAGEILAAKRIALLH